MVTPFKQNKYTLYYNTKDKSLGLLTGIIVAPRLGYRLINAAQFKSVGHPVGTGPIEGKLADASHAALYAFMTIMPISGIVSRELSLLFLVHLDVHKLHSQITSLTGHGVFRWKRIAIFLDNYSRNCHSKWFHCQAKLFHSQDIRYLWEISNPSSYWRGCETFSSGGFHLV